MNVHSVSLRSEPSGSIQTSSVPGMKGRALNTSLQIWGKREKNLCKALDGAAYTQSDTDARYSRVLTTSNYFLQKFLNQTPAVQRQISAFCLALEKSERPGRAHPGDVTRSRRWLLPTPPGTSARGFAQFEGD